MARYYSKNKSDRWLRIQNFKFYLFFVLLIALLAILASQVLGDIQQEQESYVSLSNDALDERMSSLYNELNNLPSGAGNDVLFLSSLVDVKDFIFSSSAEEEEINQDFSEFLNQNTAYKRLTITKIDNQPGLSIERQIDGKIVLSHSSLSEDFISKAINLQKNKVYISDLQKDVISGSGSLVLYYATPIFNDAEELGGILILTVDPSYFLDDVRNFSRPGEQVFLVNELGSYLANADINKEYINTGDKFNFKKDFSEVSEEILSISDKRIIETKDSIFVFRYIQPTLSKFNIYKINDSSDTKDIKDSFYWVLVSVSDRQDVDVVLSTIKQQRFVFLLLMITITIFIGLVVYSMYWRLTNKIKSQGA